MSGVSRKLMSASGAKISLGIYAVTDTAQFVQHSSSSVSSTKSLGVAYSDREIWVVVPTMSDANNAAISTLTVGGNAATKVFELADSGYTNALGVSYWRYTDNGSLGATASIAATFANIQVHTGFVIFTAQASSTLLDSYADATEDATPTGSSINTSATGWAFYCAISQNAGSGTINFFDNDGAFDTGTNEWVVYGYNSPEDNGTVSIVSPGNDGTGNRLISGISVRA